MSKRLKIIKITATHLVLLFIIGILGTFLSDYLVNINWFGDETKVVFDEWTGKEVTRVYWGARHYWYNWGCFIASLFSLIVMFSKIIEVVESK